MNDMKSASMRSWTPDYEMDQFPGLAEPFSGPPEVINPTVIPSQVTTIAGQPTKLPFNISISNIGDLKALVDRMGGIEGVMANLGKFQKFISTMQQIAPMIKLFMNKNKDSSSDSKTFTPRRRRTRRRAARKTSAKRTAKRR
jgi:hypothetical protein